MRTRLALAAIVLCLVSSAVAADAAQLTATLGAHTIIAAGVSPGSTVVFFGVAHSFPPGMYMRRVQRWATTVADTDKRGTVTLDLQQDVPRISLWAVVDLRNGELATIAGPGLGDRTIGVGNPLRRHSGQSVDEFAFSRPFLDLLYVHPGLGAWSWSAMDGGPSDIDGRSNGATAVALASGSAVGVAAGEKPTTVVPGGILIAIDSEAMRMATVKVDEPLLRGAR